MLALLGAAIGFSLSVVAPAAADIPPGVTAISAGAVHTCAMTKVGGVRCWGFNGDGRLGNGTQTSSLVPVDVVGLTADVASIGAGLDNTCAVTTSGAAKCWGNGDGGQLGNGTERASLTPVDVTGLDHDVTAVVGGDHYSCALMAWGGVKCWGVNYYGQLGNGTTDPSTVPVDVVGLGGAVIALAGGNYHVCALIADGTVQCWGSGNFGENGATEGSSTPVTVSGLSDVTAIAAGNFLSCALTTAGGVKCWGWNHSGQLGNGSTTDDDTQTPTPVAVSGLSSGVTAIAVSSGSTACALTTAGGVKCWGETTGTLLGSSTARAVPILPTDVDGMTSGVAAITLGLNHGCGLLASGAAKCWGADPYGQLGNGTIFASEPVVTPLGLSTGQSGVDGGSTHSCAVSAAGAASCWGFNDRGQLGIGSLAAASTAQPVVGLSSGVTMISAGGSHSCAVVGGAAKCWGFGSGGRLGNGSTATQSSPVAVQQLTAGVTAISAGALATCAVQSGAAKCWGSGGLGNGSSGSSNVPVAVTGLTSGVTAIAASNAFACAVVSGAAQCWGANSNGQLGNGTTTAATSPVQVSGLTSGVASIAAGDSHVCALTTGGGVKCWGNGSSGQLGNGTTVARSLTPVDVSGLTSGVVAISSGSNFSCALLATGAVKCWGANSFKQLGNGTTSIATTPTDVVGVAGAASIASGDAFSCVVLTNGGARCWGQANNGQLGDGVFLAQDVVGGAAFYRGPTFSDPLVNVASRTPATGNGAGWNKTTVTVSFACSGGVEPVSCPAPVVVGEGANQSVTRTATDAGSGSTPATISGINVDLTGPVVTATVTPARNAAGWSTDDATVHWTCSDALSGLATSCPDDTLVTDEGTTTVPAIAADVAGNTTVTSVDVKLDRTDPTISGAVVTNAGTVTIRWTCADAGSGISVCPADEDITTSPGGTSTKTATDVAGNTSASDSVTYTQSVAGAPVSWFEHTDLGSGGTMYFYDGLTLVGKKVVKNGSATFTTKSLTVGNHVVTVTYQPNAAATPVVIDQFNQVVGPADSATVLSSLVNPTVYGQVVTLKAKVTTVAPGVGTPAGNVDFYDDGILLGTASLKKGTATLTTLGAPGDHPIVAVYNGSVLNHASSSDILVQHIDGGQTVVTLSTCCASTTLGHAGNITARVNPVPPATGVPTGTVTFSDDGTVLATVALVNGKANYAIALLPRGVHHISATYSGGGGLAPSGTTSDLTQTII